MLSTPLTLFFVKSFPSAVFSASEPSGTSLVVGTLPGTAERFSRSVWAIRQSLRGYLAGLPKLPGVNMYRRLRCQQRW